MNCRYSGEVCEQILDTYKQIGTVIEAFRLNHPGKAENIQREFAGRAAIGHVRYATTGRRARLGEARQGDRPARPARQRR